MDSVRGLVGKWRDSARWHRCARIMGIEPGDESDKCADELEAALAQQPAGEAVGEAGSMPGTTGFTMAVFNARDVPVGTKIYTTPADSAPLSGRVPSYDALLIIAQSVCGALARAGLTDCDDPGEAIDALREGYEKRIAALSVPEGEAVAVLSSIRELLIANDPACLGIDEAADGRPYPIRDEVIAAITRVLTTPQGDGVDAARLDWLRDNEFDLVTRREDIDEDEYRILWFVIDPRKTTRRHLHSISGHPLGSPREAIDAAIARSAAPSAKGVE